MRRHPFTLAELLVAVAVAAAVIPVALRALLTVGNLGQTAERHRLAATLADFKLQELVITGAWFDGESSGDFGEDYPGHSWELVTDEWTEGSVAMRRVDLSVFGPARVGQTVVTLTTLVPEPEG